MIAAAHATLSTVADTVPRARLMIVLLVVTAMLSVLGALVGHPVFHLKLVTAGSAVRMLWPAIATG